MLIHTVNFEGKLARSDLFDYRTLLHIEQFPQSMFHGTYWEESLFSSLFKWEDELICQDPHLHPPTPHLSAELRDDPEIDGSFLLGSLYLFQWPGNVLDLNRLFC